MEVDDQRHVPSVADDRMTDCLLDGNPEPKSLHPDGEDSQEFGAWLKPRGRRGRGHGRSTGEVRNPNSDRRVGNEGQDSDTGTHGLEPPSRFPTHGGRSGCDSTHSKVHLSSITDFPHLETSKPVQSDPIVDDRTSSRLEGGCFSPPPGPKKLFDIIPTFTLPERVFDMGTAP